MGTRNWLLSFFQSIFFYAEENKEIHRGLEPLISRGLESHHIQDLISNITHALSLNINVHLRQITVFTRILAKTRIFDT